MAFALDSMVTDSIYKVVNLPVFHLRVIENESKNRSRVVGLDYGLCRHNLLHLRWQEICSCLLDSFESRAVARHNHASVQECDNHTSGWSLGVHENIVPGVEHDRCMIRMSDRAFDEYRSIALHISPGKISGFRIALDQGFVLLVSQAVGICTADLHRLAALPESELSDVRLAASTTHQWLILVNSIRMRVDFCRDEKPFALTHEILVLASVALLGLQSCFSYSYSLRLERCHCLRYCRNRFY